MAGSCIVVAAFLRCRVKAIFPLGADRVKLSTCPPSYQYGVSLCGIPRPRIPVEWHRLLQRLGAPESRPPSPPQSKEFVTQECHTAIRARDSTSYMRAQL